MVDYKEGDWVVVIPLQEWKDLCHKVEDRTFTDSQEEDYYYHQYPQHPVQVLKLTPPRADIIPEDPWREFWEVHVIMENDSHSDYEDEAQYGWDLFVADAFRKATDEELALYEMLFK